MSSKNRQPDPRSGQRSVLVIGLLLRLLPSDLRESYGPELRETLREQRLEPRYRLPVLGTLRFLVEVGLDVARIRHRRHTADRENRLRRHAGRQEGKRGPRTDRGPEPGPPAARERTPAFLAPRGRYETMTASLLFDLRGALRRMRRDPGFTAAALATLAIAIGANALMFSLVDGILLRPLPFPEPQELVAVYDSNPELGWPRFVVSAPNFVDYREQSTVFEGMAAYTRESVTLTGLERPRRIIGGRATAPFFPVWGVEPALGRGFRSEENRGGGGDVVVLSHGLWQELGGDPDMVGSTVEIDRTPRTVAGILPAGAPEMAAGVAVWQPLDLDLYMDSRGAHYFDVVARLEAGVSLERAAEEMRQIGARLAEAYPDTNGGWTTRLDPMLEEWVGDTRESLTLLAASVVLVLLIACVNVANLLLARSARRRREMALRSALGASRGRLVRETLVESLVLAAGGGALGLAVAYGGLGPILALLPEDLPRSGEIAVDGRVLAFGLLVALVTGVLFSLVPALQGARRDLAEPLQKNSRGSAGDGAGPLRQGLVVAEVALAVMVVAGAALLGRSLLLLSAADPGFVGEGAVVARTSLPRTIYDEPADRARFYRELLAGLETDPRVTAAGATSALPARGDFRVGFEVVGQSPVDPALEPTAQLRVVSQGYFEAMGIPLLRGRGFEETDGADTPLLTVVSRSLAERFLPGDEPLGQRIAAGFNQTGPEEKQWTVVGVVDDVIFERPGEEPAPTYYFLLDQEPAGSMDLVVRGTATADRLIELVRAETSELDPSLAVYDAMPLDRLVVEATATDRFRALLLSGFAAIALLLAALGIYGVTAYSVACRTRELGIRMALGADAGGVLGLVLGKGMALALTGIVLGTAGALAASRLIEGLLFGISAVDPLTYAGVATSLLGVSAAACLLPAWRAARVDPTEAMRSE